MTGMPADSTTGKLISRRDARLPEERGRLRQGRRHRCSPTVSCPADAPGDADLVVVNTCAFIEAARQESIDVALALADGRKRRRPARRHRLHGRALRRRARRRAARGRRGRRLRGRGRARRRRAARPQARRASATCSSCPGPAPSAPWAYVKVAEGCDRACAFCAIPSFRGKQRSRTPESIEAEVRGARRAAASPRSCSSPRTSPGTAATSASPVRSRRCCAGSTRSRADGLARVRLLYLYPSRGAATRWSSTMLELPTVVPVLRPLAAARARPAAAAHEAVGERRPLPRR